MKIDTRFKNALVMSLVTSDKEYFSMKDVKWIAKNMEIVQQFFAITDKDRQENRQVGQTLVANQIRWKKRHLDKKGQARYKVNNNMIPLMAHAYNVFGKTRQGYFDLKERQTL